MTTKTSALPPVEGNPVKFELQKISSIDEDQQLIFGWASVIETPEGEVVVDSQGHVIEPVELENAVYIFVRCGGMAGLMHNYMYAGSVVESMVFTPDKCKALGIPDGTLPVGWWVGVYVHNKEVWELVKDGTLPMFSIGGFAVLEDVEIVESENEPAATAASET